MPFTLNAPETVNVTIDKYEINSFAVDLDRQEIVVGYDKIDSEGSNRGEAVLIIDGPDFMAAIGDANTIAGTDVYSPLKQALYNQISARTGTAGSVS